MTNCFLTFGSFPDSFDSIFVFSMIIFKSFDLMKTYLGLNFFSKNTNNGYILTYMVLYVHFHTQNPKCVNWIAKRTIGTYGAYASEF